MQNREAVIGGEEVSQTHNTDNKHDTQNKPGLEVATQTMIEQVSKVSDCNMRQTRKLNAYQLKDTLKMAEVRNIPKVLNINQMSVSDIEKVVPKGILAIDSIGVEKVISPAQVLVKALSNNSLRHTVEACVSIAESHRLKTIEMESRGLEVETPRTLELVDEAKKAFDIDADEPIHTVLIDAGLHHGKVEFSRIDWTSEEEQKAGETRYAGIMVRQAGLEAGSMWRETTALNINNTTVQHLSIYYASHYCRACQTKTYSSDWAKYRGCKICHSSTDCHGLDASIQLPFVSNGHLKETSTGLIDFRVVLLPARIARVLQAVKKGHKDASEFINAISQEKNLRMRYQNHNGKTVKGPCQVQPTVFDVVNCDIDRAFLGLSVQYKTSLNSNISPLD